MIGMNSWGTNGRSGNMLMQWAFISSLSRKLSVPYVLPKWNQAHLFKAQLPEGKVGGAEVKERSYGYSDYSDLDFTKDINFFGHFQNEKYFDDKVKSEIQFTDTFKNQVRSKFSDLFKRPTISIGVRRTDYLKLPYYQLSANYYISALFKHFPDWRDYNLVFISDDLEWCRGHFGCLDNAFFPLSKDMEQMCLSSLCDHFIIANSTFHWWAAFMGEKEGTKVVQPTKLFIGSLLEKHGDVNFYSDRWIKHDEEPVDLMDMTFTIPTMIDHPDRKENLDLTICLLQKNFHTSIIIGEQGTDQCAGYGLEYIKFEDKDFHRTKMLNEMAKKSKTPFIANWDCDVFVPPMQIIQSVYYLRQGHKMVYPYHDKFCRIMRKYRKMIFPWYDIGVFFDGDYSRDTPSFGGAVMWNKDTYFEIGGENENFISFGPEDIERMERAVKLGIHVTRTRGYLYHFNHWCGPDSSVVNPHFKNNHKERNKVKEMSAQELKEYINSWPWHSPYTGSYYETITEDAIRSRDAVFEILGIDKSATVCDVGGGVGQWGVGLKNYTCIDYRVPLDRLLVGVEQYIDHDLRTPLNMGEKFDVVICCEVIEHLEEQYTDTLLDTICSHVKPGGIIIFSGAIPNQGGRDHFTERFQTHWAKKFEARGFYGVQPRAIRTDKRIENYYRQNIVIYTRSRGSAEMSLVEDFVLPEYYLAITNHLKG